MSTLTSELNLSRAVDADDTEQYLTVALANSLTTLDGLFNSTTGHTHGGAHQGGVLGPGAFPDNTIPGAKIVDGSIYSAKIADGTISKADLVSTIVEDLFGGATTQQSANYAVAAPVMFVFCNGGLTITLPQASLTNRPITVCAMNAQVTIATAGGSAIVGGSIDINTGSVLTGKINSGDSITWKGDGGNTWRAV